jgi:threonine/homoserine/homoserine lactone efflux protein
MDIISLILFLIIVCFSPGPNNFLASYSGLNFGLKKSLPLIHGVALGWSTVLFLMSGGLAVVFRQYESFQLYLKIISSFFLVYLALKIAMDSNTQYKRIPNQITFIQMYIFQFFNPKGVFIALTAVSTYMHDVKENLNDFFVLNILGLIFSYSSITTWCLFGTSLEKLFINPNYFKIFNYLMSLMLVGCIFLIWLN